MYTSSRKLLPSIVNNNKNTLYGGFSCHDKCTPGFFCHKGVRDRNPSLLGTCLQKLLLTRKLLVIATGFEDVVFTHNDQDLYI